jgi:hypothetical protein
VNELIMSRTLNSWLQIDGITASAHFTHPHRIAIQCWTLDAYEHLVQQWDRSASLHTMVTLSDSPSPYVLHLVRYPSFLHSQQSGWHLIGDSNVLCIENNQLYVEHELSDAVQFCLSQIDS